MDKLLTNSKVIHPALEDGCIVCHQPHGSSNNYLLKSTFPAGNYVPSKKESFAVCWECHDSDLFELEKTTTATNFRNGDVNLHNVHRKGKNERSCIMCHNVHASPNEHLIEDKVKFGEWELPIRYTPRENGGSCFPGCHAEKSYSR
ncbi:MAG: cytochrome c3 family protein [Bacteroidota bacterium]|nr:cytochrome c3 family protein [Bacteroidota bacterium]